MNKIDSIFKPYDIRGKVDEELNSEIATQIARGFDQIIPPGDVAVGRDMREESEELVDGFIHGLLLAGRNVIELGQCSSDMVYYAVGSRQLAGGAMITASHNAKGYNGIKLTKAGVSPIGQDSGLADIKRLVVANKFVDAPTRGQATTADLTDDFVQWAGDVAAEFGELKALSIGYDAGNGMAGIFVKNLLKHTSLQIKGLYLNPDGSFPFHQPNPLDYSTLKDLVSLILKNQLDCGVAFDGDGDRAFFIDEKGEIVSSSVLGALLATKILQNHPNAKIVYSALASRVVPETIEALGGTAIISRVGHSFIKAKMAEVGAVLGIEHSGHFYFRSNFNADSGLITALATLGIISSRVQPLSKIVHPYRKYYAAEEQNFSISDSAQLLKKLWDTFSDGVASEIDGLSIKYPDWWFNVRLSNTEPVLRLNVEAKSKKLLLEKLEMLTSIVKKG